MNFEKLLKEKADFDAQFKAKSETELTAAFKEAFEKVPELESVQWRQYTPFFNDGSPCEFSVHGFDATFNVPVTMKSYTDDEKRDTIKAGELIDGLSYYCDDHVCAKAYNELKEIEKFGDNNPDLFKATFGDGVSVKVTREGFEVVEIDHD